MTLTLVPLDTELAVRLSAGNLPDGLGPPEAAPLGAEVAKACVTLYERTGARAPWTCYLAVEQGTEGDRVVGSCGFKDEPRGGAVEIAYFTFPSQEGRGIGRGMARALLAIAGAQPGVSEILAHTLPEPNASTRILMILGFRWASAVQDPDDGTVWRWARATGRGCQDDD